MYIVTGEFVRDGSISAQHFDLTDSIRDKRSPFALSMFSSSDLYIVRFILTLPWIVAFSDCSRWSRLDFILSIMSRPGTEAVPAGARRSLVFYRLAIQDGCRPDPLQSRRE